MFCLAKHERRVPYCPPKIFLDKKVEDNFLSKPKRNEVWHIIKGSALVYHQAFTPVDHHGKAVYKNHPLRFDDTPTFARLLFLSEIRAGESRLNFSRENEKRAKIGSKMGILALKTQKRTPKSQLNQRSGLANVVYFNTKY